MDFDRNWTAFALDAEIDHYGTTRIATAHNKARAEITTLRAENERLRQDAEHWERRLEIARMEQMRAESMRDGYFEVLMGIRHLLAPADVEANGKIYRFAPQDTTLCMDAWREMSKRIREIPESLAKARAARQEEG